jgi:hypothetical protein
VTKRSSEKCLPIKISHGDHSSIGCRGVEKEPHANKVEYANFICNRRCQISLEDRIIYQSTLKVMMYRGPWSMLAQLQINWMISSQLIVENEYCNQMHQLWHFFFEQR